jgi:8-oxo-dGTP diphosphatase
MSQSCTSDRKQLEVVAAVVVDKGEVLCMQRGASKYAYTAFHWEFPGGKIECGETPQEALRRELQEEMDYKVQVHEMLGEVFHTYPDFSIHLMAYRCSADTREFHRKEHIEHCWLSPTEMSTLDWCAADYPLIRQIISRLSKDCDYKEDSNS